MENEHTVVNAVENVEVVEVVESIVKKANFLDTGWGKVALVAGTAIATEVVVYGAKKLAGAVKKKWQEHKAKKNDVVITVTNEGTEVSEKNKKK